MQHLATLTQRYDAALGKKEDEGSADVDYCVLDEFSGSSEMAPPLSRKDKSLLKRKTFCRQVPNLQYGRDVSFGTNAKNPPLAQDVGEICPDFIRRRCHITHPARTVIRQSNFLYNELHGLPDCVVNLNNVQPLDLIISALTRHL
jgi:hypothetical protein